MTHHKEHEEHKGELLLKRKNFVPFVSFVVKSSSLRRMK